MQYNNKNNVFFIVWLYMKLDYIYVYSSIYLLAISKYEWIDQRREWMNIKWNNQGEILVNGFMSRWYFFRIFYSVDSVAAMDLLRDTECS